MKYGLSLSKAVEVLDSLVVPSELINSVEIAEAIRMGSIALNQQITLGQMLQDIKDEGDGSDYSEKLVIDLLDDVYMLSENNDIE